MLALALILSSCSRRPRPVAEPAGQALRGFDLIQTEAGKTRWSLRAREAEMRDADGRVELYAPRLRIYDRAGRPASDIRSERGSFLQAGQDLRLWGGVVAVSRDEGSTLPTTIRTEAIDYVSAAKEFRTDRPVEIVRDRAVLRGSGLTASQDLSEIRVHRQETRF